MELRLILEAILFTAQKPLTLAELRGVLSGAAEHTEEAEARVYTKTKAPEIESTLEALAQHYAEAGRAFRLVCVAGGWQFVSRPEYAPWLKALVGERARPARLSQPGLETLTIIAYRQPITRAEVEQIRGVTIDGVLQTLLERGLVESAGRAEVVGRPMTYRTTPLFLEYFGLRTLEELPAADELRRLPVERPPSLVTAEPGLATVPPEQLQLTPQVPPVSAPETPEATPPAPAPATTETAPEASAGGGGSSPEPSAPLPPPPAAPGPPLAEPPAATEHP